ncbi:hypothetical protein [Pseudoalteromonas byunsanensis]|uniref:Uncharacterized protein n=1 Tax=Pseudoalteromonas byunsanensis TaxID=327939 RepID=A0A1S1N9L2_9GAMM|nr:hypothetical protein [Pseudoalteromonas byunsanensis]OHU94960.1 hypothetical protein BIW53_13160 [Pseudoalteromonas byunsanensis]
MNSEFDKYISNLVANKANFPDSLFEFGTDQKRYELNHPKSLHDSWVTSLTIAENRNRKRPFDASLSIILTLLGQQHDRDIILTYSNVKSYELIGHENGINYNDTYHGDVLTHEVSFENELYKHIIELRSGSIFKVRFTEFKVNEYVYT